MFCGNCGTQMPDDAQFCGNCGVKVVEAKPEQTARDAQPTAQDAVIIAEPIVEPVKAQSEAPQTAGPEQTAQDAHHTPSPTGYFISINHQESGPYTVGQIQAMILSGQITLNHWTRKETSASWVKIDQIPKFRAFFVKQQPLPNISVSVNNQQPPPQVSPSFDPDRKIRHGFTSFWLFLMLIIHILGVLVMVLEFAIPEMDFRTIEPNITDFEIWILRISVAAFVYGLIKLIGFRKFGFWLYLGTSVAVAILYYMTIGLTGANLLSGAVMLGILFGVLHFKNAYNAKSTWEQLW